MDETRDTNAAFRWGRAQAVLVEVAKKFGDAVYLTGLTSNASRSLFPDESVVAVAVMTSRALYWPTVSLLACTSQVEDRRGPHPSLRMIVHRSLSSFCPGRRGKKPSAESRCSSGNSSAIVEVVLR